MGSARDSSYGNNVGIHLDHLGDFTIGKTFRRSKILVVRLNFLEQADSNASYLLPLPFQDLIFPKHITYLSCLHFSHRNVYRQNIQTMLNFCIKVLQSMNY
ncbi:hypothetical protein M8J77_013247 [Diaphorina citri]|nr:hypothetical protein M8J77_013247 [Diaphorina citri]